MINQRLIQRRSAARTERARRIRMAVMEGLERWDARRQVLPSRQRLLERAEAAGVQRTAPAREAEGVLAALPRRKQLTPVVVQDIQPRTLRLAKPFKTSFFYTVRRLFIWVYGIASFLGGILGDQIRRRNTLERRAIRLRKTLSRIGGTFIKFGQQMSIRIDLIPYRYCVELTKLLDKVDPFPSEQAIQTIERTTGRPLAEIFQTFDPVPIGSASIACVYQAVLHTGEQVAVKVRRPGIGKTFLADLRVLGWLFRLLEFTTLVRPGFTMNVLQELRNTLMEELDFFKEARFQELFRRRSKKAKRPFFSAPRVYPHLSGEDVLVQEFVSGVWLSELIAAVEHQHEPTLAYIESLNIDPKIVARRLLWTSHWGLWENVFFHADPHPANIIIQQDSHLMFIDFGSSGTLTESRRLAMHELFAREKEEDLEGIARVALTLLEPLPPIDSDTVVKAIESVFWDALIAQRSKHSEWWEKTSANLWLGFFKVINTFKIPMSVDHVRMIRATLLYDTLAARLDHEIDIGHEYRAFMNDVGKTHRKRLHKKMRRRLEKGLTDRDYVRLDRLVKLGDRALYLSQRLFNLRTFNFGALLGKFVSTLILLTTLVFQSLFVTALLVLIVYVFQRATGGTDLSFWDTAKTIMANPWYLGGLITLVFVNGRRILFRLADKEV